MKHSIAAILLALFCVLSVFALSGCSDADNSAVVGEWTPSTVSINGTTISYSELDTENRDFGFHFYADGNCKIKIGGIQNDGTYTFNETSLDVQYGGKSQKLSYEGGVLTLKLNYNNQTTSYMFTRVAEINE